jgi:hypothetical protein
VSVHGGLVGSTGCGKSRFVREVLIPSYRRRGIGAIILDPVAQEWGPPDPAGRWQTADPMEWIAKLKSSRRVLGIVDECSQHIYKDHQIRNALSWSATVSRNSGILCAYIGQRIIHIPTDYRGNIGWGYIFTQIPDDAELVCGMYALPRDPWVQRIAALPDGWCYHIADSYTPPRLIEVFKPIRRKPVPGLRYT